MLVIDQCLIDIHFTKCQINEPLSNIKIRFSKPRVNSKGSNEEFDKLTKPCEMLHGPHGPHGPPFSELDKLSMTMENVEWSPFL